MRDFIKYLVAYFNNAWRIRGPIRLTRWSAPIHGDKWIGESPSILVLKLDHFGDFITALESFKRLKRAWPKSRITIVCSPENVILAKRLNLFDRIVPFTFFPPSLHITLREVVDLKSRRREFSCLGLGNFDLAIDLRHDGDTRPLLFEVSALYRAGYTSPLISLPLDISLPEIEDSARQRKDFIPLHAELRLTLLAELTIMTLKRRNESFYDELTLREDLNCRLPSSYYVFSTASGRPIRKWPVERAKELCARLNSKINNHVILVGGASDLVDANYITSDMIPDTYTNLVGKLSLEDLAPVLAKASFVIGYDTGVTHLAAYLGTPTLGIYAGISDINVWGPFGNNAMMLRSEVPCSPCYLREIKECKFNRMCLTSISVDDAFEAASNIASQYGASKI